MSGVLFNDPNLLSVHFQLFGNLVPNHVSALFAHPNSGLKPFVTVKQAWIEPVKLTHKMIINVF